MRVLIDQQYHLGHHYAYVSHLLRAVLENSTEVIVALTQEGLEGREFKEHLSGFVSTVKFEPVHALADPSLPKSDRFRVHESLRQAVKRFKPDYILIPSGDAQSMAMSWFRWSGRGHVPGSVPTEVGIHFGTGYSSAGVKTRIRDMVNAVNLGASGVRRVHLVNQLFYEECRRLPGVSAKFSTVPHPAPQPARLSKRESRSRLEIPEDGRYIGLAASLDSRKAIPQFLRAFQEATTEPTDRILLAGYMNNTHRATIDAEFQGLLRSGRLILLSGFLDSVTYQTAISALDVVCTPYPGFGGLSATLLEGVAAGRPILANRFGWSEAMVNRFRLGWTCEVLNPRDFMETIRVALRDAEHYQETEAIKRLQRFHTPENFARTWTQGLRAAQGKVDEQPYSWSWVQELAAETT